MASTEVIPVDEEEPIVDVVPGNKKFHWKRKCFLGVTIPAGIGVIVTTIWAYSVGRIEVHHVGWITAGFCTFVATWMSGFLIYLHLTSYTQPDLQQKLIRIILMVPVYAIDSFLSLVFKDAALYINLLRDIYESYVIYTFFNYLLQLLDGQRNCIDSLAEQQPQTDVEPGMMRHTFPLCKLPPFRLDATFFIRVRRLINQYMIVKPICTLLACYLAAFGKYHEGSFDLSEGYIYIAVVVNFSVTFAFGALYYFYLATKALLKPHKPVGKFICVKAVIFLSFWQSVVVAVLVKVGVLKCPWCQEYTTEEVSDGVQEYLICVEMMIIAFAHRTIFTHEPFEAEQGGHRTRLLPKNIVHSLAVDDVVNDVSRDVREVGGELWRGVRGQTHRRTD